ncbi:protein DETOXIFICATION 14-like isoform X2 [Magnolia sinica]|uniref:protein DETOXIFICATION 14-like isoform X2 n=1 Tax=Magnolia sinica TaxID=86752 RepID=UPI00265A1FEA|nr:protein DETOXIFICATION 14-like isoform X2 [Magnolia sinica]
MEEGLLCKEDERGEKREGGDLTWSVVRKEMKKLGMLAGPMVTVSVSQYLQQVISLMMVGHLGALSLSSTAIATSLCSVTGFSLIMGMASALETLCGQAYGAQQYQKLGIHTQRAVFALLLVALPLSLLWVFMGKILIFIGQDPLISYEAGKYAMWMIPALYAYAVLHSLIRFLQSQSLILPMLLTTLAILCFHIPLSWVLVFKSGLGSVGAALAISISYWLNVIILGLYVKYSPSCKKTRAPLSKELFRGLDEFFRLAIPSAVMICLEWWSFELLILLSGLLPNPELETSVLSICLTTISLLYTIPYGFGAAASTRVSNELGAGKPEAARLAVCVVMCVAVLETAIVSTTLFSIRFILGYAYSNEKEVIDYVRRMVPLICLSVITDSLQGVLSGVARGCGWQHIGAYVNLGAFYLVGIPVASILGFLFNLKGRGLWMGIVGGSAVQSVLLSFITGFTNWQQQADKARARVFVQRLQIDNGILK